MINLYNKKRKNQSANLTKLSLVNVKQKPSYEKLTIL